MKNFYLVIAMLFIGHFVSAQCGTTVIVGNDSCFGACNGSILFIPASGTPPYSLTVNGVAQPSFTSSYVYGPICSGSYYYRLQDFGSSCGDSTTVVVTQPSPLTALISFTNITCVGNNDGSIGVSPVGGVSPYEYSIDGGVTWQIIASFTNLTSGSYTIHIRDANFCSITQNLTIAEPPPIIVNINVIPSSCGLCDGFATAIVSGGTFPYSYLWTPGALSSITLSNFCSGSYSLFVTDAHGCLDSTGFTTTLQCDSVWPGDADYDGVAGNNDILALGISFGATGPVRAGATNLWTGQTCTNWTDTLPTGINFKQSDCDGNGLVNADDTLAVFLNYGLIHPRLTPPNNNTIDPDLFLETVVDTAGLNQLVHVKIHLGSTATPVSSIYGLAFTLHFDPTLIDTTNVGLDYSTSALGTINTNLMSFQYPRYSAGTMDVALTRTNHLDATNIDSVIGILDVVITDNVSTIELLRFGVSNVTAIQYNGNPVALNSRGDSVVVDPSFNGIQYLNPEKSISVFPSPVHDYLKVKSDFEIEKAELVNDLGIIFIKLAPHQKNFSLDVTGIANGIYFLQLTSSTGSVRKRVCVMH